MAITDDLIASDAEIDARPGLTPEQKANEKRLARYRIKGNAHKITLESLPGQTFTVGAGPNRLRVRINWLWVNPETGDLHLDLSIWRGNNPEVPLIFSNPVIIRNPPILVPDGSGGYREDLVAAGRQMLVDFAGRL